MSNNMEGKSNVIIVAILGITIVASVFIGALLSSYFTGAQTVTITSVISSTETKTMIIPVCSPTSTITLPYVNVSFSGGYGEVSDEVANISVKFRDLWKALVELQEKYSIPVHDFRGLYSLVEKAAVVTTATIPAPVPSPTPVAEIGVPEYSTTNVQVFGVDEHDIVKTNGTHIFVVAGGAVYIVRAYPVDNMEKEYIINVTSDIWNITGPIEVKVGYGNITIPVVSEYLSVRVRGLYFTGGRIIVVAETYYPHSYIFYESTTLNETQIPAYILYPTTWILLYSSNGELLDYAWVTGNLVDSRLAESKLVVVAREGIYYVPRIMYYGAKIVEPRLPRAYTSWGPIPEEATAIIGLPIDQATNVMLLDISTGNRSAVSVMGATARFIYMTSDGDVYILAPAYWYRILPLTEEIVEKIKEAKNLDELREILKNITIPEPSKYGETAVVYISSRNSTLRVEAFNVLEGMITNQFGVDVYNGVLRIALQRGWNRGFNLYTLNATTLELIGRLEGIADGERVHGVRFMGPRLYIVTYRTVDPLFVIDLSDPRKPEILGYRKGPGFDEYLHPWNETILIGLGFTDDRRLRLTTYKINPDASIEQISQIILDDHWSPVFISPGGHHAFLLDRKHNLVLFPGESRTMMVIEDGTKKVIEKGGVHVIKIDPNSMKLGYIDYLDHPGALRQIYIDDIIYTISSSKIKAYQLPELQQVGQVMLEESK